MFIHTLIDIPIIERVDSPSGRLYRTPDGDFPSITTVLGSLSKDHLNEWIERVGEGQANKIKRQAANRGTRLHSHCEMYLKNDSFDIKNPFDKMLFESIRPYLDEIQEIFLQETPMWSKELRIAGTVDCIAKYGNELAVIDFKTSTKAKQKEWIDSYFMQACAYSMMYEERTGIHIDKLVIMIANEEDVASSFVDWRGNWEEKLKKTIDTYHQNS